MLCDNCNNEHIELFEVEAGRYRKRFRKDKVDGILVCERCLTEEKERGECLSKIIESDDDKKLILAGPGTGKTHTFKEYIKKFNQEDSIYIVTFINNLVNDLKSDIKNDNVKINTFHKFCYHLLKLLGRDYRYCGSLTKIVLEDIKIVEDRSIYEKKIKEDFNNYNPTKDIGSYFVISSYYNAVGNDNIMFGLLKILNESGGIDLTERYKQIIIDEYQDFNFVESEIIKILSRNNKILIAGDDDQALYTFKGSDPKYIRDLYNNPDFAKFKLPFCSRCPEVIIDSLNYFVGRAKSMGLLGERIDDKPYKCYFPDKYLDCQKYPKILWHKTSIRTNNYSNIENIIINNIKEYINNGEIELGNLNFLILCPDNRKSTCDKIKENIIQKLSEQEISIKELSKKEKNDGLSIKDGYNILKEENGSNLGWRIVIKNDPFGGWENIIKEAILSNQPICKFLSKEYLNKHLALLDSFDNKETEVEDREEGVKILFTNFYGSKGLSSDHVFILFAQDNVFPQRPNNPTEDEIYKFLVAMTRPKKSLNFITTYPHRSTFIKMLPSESIE